MKTLLLTGAYGYLGLRIATAMKADGEWRLRLAGHAATPSGLEFGDAEMVRLDVVSPDSCLAACRGVDAVVHLAALNEIDSVQDPARALLVNGLGTAHLLAAANQAGVGRFIYFSTIHVYGPLVGDITEETPPRPFHPYAITHRVAEDYLRSSLINPKVEAVVLRLSNAMGAPLHPDVRRWTLVANELCREAVTKCTLTLKNLYARRDFIALSDVAAATKHVLNLETPRLGDGVFNLGGGGSLSVLELAEMIADECSRRLGYRPAILPPAAPPPAPPAFTFQIGKLRAAGFCPSGDLAAEIGQTLALCQSWGSHPAFAPRAG